MMGGAWVAKGHKGGKSSREVGKSQKTIWHIFRGEMGGGGCPNPSIFLKKKKLPAKGGYAGKRPPNSCRLPLARNTLGPI